MFRIIKHVQFEYSGLAVDNHVSDIAINWNLGKCSVYTRSDKTPYQEVINGNIFDSSSVLRSDRIVFRWVMYDILMILYSGG